MKKFLLLLTLGNFLIINVMLAQYITGEDNASNYSNNDFPSEGNLGYGFGTWTSSSNSGGWFRGTATNNGASNSSILDVSGNSFGMWATDFSNVGRNFSALPEGGKISFSLSFQWDNGNKGFSLYTGGVNNTEVFNFNLNSSGYTWTGGGSQAMTSWDVPPGDRQFGVVIAVNITQTATGLDYNIQAAAGDGGFGTKTGSVVFAGNINACKFYVSGAGGSGGNFYFNNLAIEIDDPSNVSSTANVKIKGNVELGVAESLTVNNLTVSSGNSFTLLSSAAGTASLITNGTVSGDVTIQRYVAGDWSTNNSGWHLISSPVTTQPITDFTTTGGGNGYDFYGYNEATNTWMNYKAAGFEAWNGSANFVVGRGYSISYQATQTGKAFEGILNNSNVTHTNLSLTTGQGEGWHLVGNPFASAIDWSNVNWVKTGFNSYAKVWVGSSYKDVTDDYSNIIPSANGFWVKASNASNTLTIPTQARTHNALNWLKSSAPIGYVILTAVDVENNMSQECIIRMKDESTDGFDENLDAPFMAGNAPQIYTVIENKVLSMNSVPSYANKTFELGFVKNIASVFTIQLNMDNIPEGEVISLFDKKLSQYFELTKGFAYEFTSEPGDDPNRFLLHFGAVGIDEALPTTAVAAYVSNNILYVLNAQGKVQVDVLDLAGRMVYSQSMQAEGLSSTPINLSAGVYVVRLNDGQTTRANKVIVQ
jgi:hypothetical protein